MRQLTDNVQLNIRGQQALVCPTPLQTGLQGHIPSPGLDFRDVRRGDFCFPTREEIFPDRRVILQLPVDGMKKTVIVVGGTFRIINKNTVSLFSPQGRNKA